MNMFPTYQQTSALLGKALADEAKRCVRVHGRAGAGDSLGADNILACKAAYGATCVERELVVNPSNTLAQDLQAHFRNAMS